MALSDLKNFGYGNMDQGTLQQLMQRFNDTSQFEHGPNQVTYNGFNYIPTADGFLQFKDNPANDTGGSVQNYNGAQYSRYGIGGDYQGSGNMSGITANSLMQDLAPFIMVAAPFAATAMGVGAAGAAASSAAGNSFDGGLLNGVIQSGTQNGVGASGFATSGLGSGTVDTLGNIGDAGITNSPFTSVGTQAPIPGIAGAPGTWESAIAPAAGSTAASSMGSAAGPGVYTLPNGTTVPTPPGFNPSPTDPVTGGPVVPPGTIPKVPPIPGSGGGGGTTPGGGGGGFNPMDLLTLLGGAYDMKRQQDYQQKMLDYLHGRQDINDKMYLPGSPEANYMQQQMDAKDAAAGRNSQYGVRADNLAGQLAKLRMDSNTQMTTGIANVYSNAINKQGGADAGILSALGNLSKNGGGVSDWFNQFGKAISSGNWNDFTSWYDSQTQTPKSTVDTSGTTTPDTQDPLTGGAT